MNIDSFRSLVKDYYAKNRRSMPWRDTITPYGVFLSEIMLQQTQVPRVMVKYAEFTERFKSFEELAKATPAEVLATWQGLGYNRRGLFLHKSAQMIMEEFGGELPRSVELVDSLPGIGQATAAAIVAYTFNIPTVFIETNIRRVFIHHFFEDKSDIDDKELLPIVEAALDKDNPRDWYYALMDYGTYLAKTVENPNRKSKHYSVQSKFEGSNRQVRGALLRFFVGGGSFNYDEILKGVEFAPERIDKALASMVKDCFLVEDKKKYRVV
jgi:A/G-specific adenine glycosylase